MERDREIEIPTTADRDAHREIGEMLLRVDELEDTLHAVEERPALCEAAAIGPPEEAVRRLEARIRSERAKIEALERRGPLPYDEIEQAIRVSETMG